MFKHAGLVLLVLSFLQPMHLLPWVSWHSEVLAFSALMLIGMGEVFRKNLTKQPCVEISGTTFLFLSWLACLVAVQFICGIITFFGDALIIWFYIAFCFFAIKIGYSMVVNDGLPQALLIAAVISTGIALVQVLWIWPDLDWVAGLNVFRRPGANMGQPNHLATLLLMGIASLVFLTEKQQLNIKISCLLFVFLMLGLTLTESRTGLLSYFLICVWFLLMRHRLGMQIRPIFVVLSCVGFLGALLVWPFVINFIHAGGWMSGVVVEPVNTSAGTRIIVWPQLIEAAFQRPWFGWGLREVSEAHNAVLHSHTKGEAFVYAHNIVIDIAIGMGLPLAGVLFLATVVWVVRRLIVVKAMLSWYCFSLIFLLAIHSMLEFPFAYAYFLLPVMIAVGMLERELALSHVWRVPKHTISVASFGIVLILIWSAIEYSKIEEDFRVARFEALRIGHTPIEYVRPHIVLLTQLDALLEGVRVIPTPDMHQDRIELLRKVAMRFPWIATQNRYALSLALNGHSEEANRQLLVMRAMHGDKAYAAIRGSWLDLANSKYPQLRMLVLPWIVDAHD